MIPGILELGGFLAVDYNLEGGGISFNVSAEPCQFEVSLLEEFESKASSLRWWMDKAFGISQSFCSNVKILTKFPPKHFIF